MAADDEAPQARAASYRFRVDGRVQGVGFRESTRRTAMALGLQGWVRNRADGSVEGLACGDAPALEQLQHWLGHGPPAARVDRLEWQPSNAEQAPGTGFVVLR